MFTDHVSTMADAEYHLSRAINAELAMIAFPELRTDELKTQMWTALELACQVEWVVDSQLHPPKPKSRLRVLGGAITKVVKRIPHKL